mgnify:CR=1 FL=1
MPKILVTGGAGYIGSHTNMTLSLKGYETLIIDNLVNGHRELVRWGEFIVADLADKEQLRQIFSKNDIEAVMHFAALAYVEASVADPQSYYYNNVVNTIRLLEVMIEFGVNIFIFSSTCATYGIPQAIPITEQHPTTPISPYGRSKLIVENILDDYSRAYDIRYVSLRYFNAAGADPEGRLGEWHEPETHLIPLILEAASNGCDIVKIFGTDYDTADGTCIRDYIHVTDLAQAHIQALEYLVGGGTSDIFNLGNGNGFSVREVIACAKEVTQKEISTAETRRRAGDPAVLVGSAEKAYAKLKWQPKYTGLNGIIRTAWKWHQKSFTNKIKK